MKKYATEHPVAFSIVATLLVLILYVLAGIAAALSSRDLATSQTIESLGRVAAAALAVALIWRLGWVRGVGLQRAGGWAVWLLTAVVVAYQLIVAMFAFFGDLEFTLPNSTEAAAVALNGSAAGLLEEIVFRGVILYALILAWGRERPGILKAALLSSLLFSGSHLIRLAMGGTIPLVSLLMIDSLVSGMYYAAFVVCSGSVWPVIAIHAGLNAAVGARAIGVEGFRETVTGWLIVLASEIPLLLLALYAIHRSAVRYEARLSGEPST